jgi:phosphoglucosamine mutase
VLERLGARVEPLNAEGDGSAINAKSGAAHPDFLAASVPELGADAGVAFDGDADRAMFVDSEGAIIDGDDVMAACALAMHEEGRLAEDTVVVTVMANLGLRRAMEEAGIRVVETQVGDRYVLEEMRRTGATLGGEQSGHVIFLEQATTGDGLLTAVRLLSLARKKGKTLKELASTLHRYPQVLQNIPTSDARAVVEDAGLAGAIRRAEETLGDRGRVLVRASGTEPLVRIMVEAESEDQARQLAEALAEAARSAA